LLRAPDRRVELGRTARAHAEENFDPARNARRIESIYADILPARERIPILYVHHRPQLGGAPPPLAHLTRISTRGSSRTSSAPKGLRRSCSRTPARSCTRATSR